ncbi:MAG: hypothetical protein RRY40_02470 [Oscillospiraceae bacterium]
MQNGEKTKLPPQGNVMTERERNEKIQRLEEENMLLLKSFVDDKAEIDAKKLTVLDPQIKCADDIPQEIFIIMAQHCCPIEKAYEAYKVLYPKGKIHQMGDIRSNIGEKDYYSRDEVAKMSKAEVDRNLARIEKSMTKWR